MTMRASTVVDNLLENGPEYYGPPEPDAYQKALGSTRDLRDLHRRADRTMHQLERSLQIERQLKKHGVTRDQVVNYIRADQQAHNTRPSGQSFQRFAKPTYPPDAIVGMDLKDGRRIMFDFPVVASTP